MEKTSNKMPEPMFRDLVRRMRDAQNEYFTTRSHLSLARARALEREVDKDLRADTPEVQEQPTLFG